jgi:hypothetical protein
MQPIMETAWDDIPPSRPLTCRMPIMSASFYPLTVFLWVLGVATVGVIVGSVCMEFIHGYTDLLRSLSG